MPRPFGTTKDPNRRRIFSPRVYGKNEDKRRKIDYGGPAHNGWLRRGYKLNRSGTKLIKDATFNGDRNAPLPRGRPRGKAKVVPVSERVINPVTKRSIKIGGPTFRKIENNFFFDEAERKFLDAVVDPKMDGKVKLNSDIFKYREKCGYIYNKLDNTLTKPSHKSSGAFDNSMVDHDLAIVSQSDPIVQMQKLDRRIKYLINKSLKQWNGIELNSILFLKLCFQNLMKLLI